MIDISIPFVSVHAGPVRSIDLCRLARIRGGGQVLCSFVGGASYPDGIVAMGNVS